MQGRAKFLHRLPWLLFFSVFAQGHDVSPCRAELLAYSQLHSPISAKPILLDASGWLENSPPVGSVVHLKIIGAHGTPEELEGHVLFAVGPHVVVVDSVGQVHECSSTMNKIVSGTFVAGSLTTERYRGSRVNLPEAIGAHPNESVHFAIVGPDGNTTHLVGQAQVDPSHPEQLLVHTADGQTHTLDLARLETNSASEYDMQVFFVKGPASERRALETRNAAKPLRLVGEIPPDAQAWTDKLLQSQKVFNNEDFYLHLQSHPELTDRLLKLWYRDGYKKQIATLQSELPQKVWSLLLDPGVTTRLEQFQPFAKSYLRAHPHAGAWEVRTQFSASLGNRKLFRGMVLTPADAEYMLAHGISPPAGKAEELRQPLARLLSGNAEWKRGEGGLTPVDEANNRWSDRTVEKSMVMSFSAYPEIANSIGYHDSKSVDPTTHQITDPKKKFYVFEADVPVIDTWQTAGSLASAWDEFAYGRVVHLQNKDYQLETDTGVEIFVPYLLPSGNHLKMTRVNEVPERYLWKSK